MLTVGILIAVSSLAQAPGGDLGAYYESLVGTSVKVWLPDEISANPELLGKLPPDYAGLNNPSATYRGGKLTRVRPLPSGNGYYLEIEWDEPWLGQLPLSGLNDTIRIGRRPYTLNVVSEDPAERGQRHRENWERLGYTLIGKDPVDPAQWARADEVQYATQALELLRQSEAQQASAVASEAVETAPGTAAEPRRRSALSGRGPQVLVSLAALVLAGIVVKTLLV